MPVPALSAQPNRSQLSTHGSSSHKKYSSRCSCTPAYGYMVHVLQIARPGRNRSAPQWLLLQRSPISKSHAGIFLGSCCVLSPGLIMARAAIGKFCIEHWIICCFLPMTIETPSHVHQLGILINSLLADITVAILTVQSCSNMRTMNIMHKVW